MRKITIKVTRVETRRLTKSRVVTIDLDDETADNLRRASPYAREAWAEQVGLYTTSAKTSTAWHIDGDRQISAETAVTIEGLEGAS
jgi:hypothetical protein